MHKTPIGLIIMDNDSYRYNPQEEANRHRMAEVLGYALIALLILVIVLFSFYSFQNSQQYWCKINSGVSCGTLVFSSAKNMSSAVIVGINTKSYALLDPELAMNTSMSGQVIGSCRPYFVLPGGVMTCSVTINTQRIKPGSLVSGDIQIIGIACPSGNPSQCNSPKTTIYTGTFNTHSSSLLTPTPETIKISTSGVYQFGNREAGHVTANVSLLGYPVSGANVSFTSSDPQAVSFGSSTAPTNSNGIVTTTFSALKGSGTVVITAYFGGYNASVPLNLTTPSTVTFKINGVSDVNAYVLTLDGQNVSTIQMPASVTSPSGSNVIYSFANVIPYQKGIRYAFNTTTGCGQTHESATFAIQSNCTIVANYNTQYLLSMYALPSTDTSAIFLGSMWYNGNSQVTITETPSAGFTFTGWSGTGNGAYSGANPMHNISIDNPISETALFKNASSSKSTVSTTTQTTSILTITTPPSYSGCPCPVESSTTVSTTVATTSPTTSPTTQSTSTQTTSTTDTTAPTTNPTTAPTVSTTVPTTSTTDTTAPTTNPTTASTVSTTTPTTSTESTIQTPVSTICIHVSPGNPSSQCIM